MEIAWTPELRRLLSGGVHIALDGDEAAAIDDVLRQLREAGIEPDREQAATMVREERSKRTES
ncbi:hypothetical protein [Agrococcus jenensis]|uniref:Uncharacterized protein n=1 Tax=Agrococcus jenensis TaxID=46353 RepID=A0A3N2AX16_9MICO|nr:hypothetical protein [Agrococcus jenensis]ROR67312.1 hypothetical protein EDD26_2723 [Agrococcus jenensis]